MVISEPAQRVVNHNGSTIMVNSIPLFCMHCILKTLILAILQSSSLRDRVVLKDITLLKEASESRLEK
jgi:hypothetical protein